MTLQSSVDPEETGTQGFGGLAANLASLVEKQTPFPISVAAAAAAAALKVVAAPPVVVSSRKGVAIVVGTTWAQLRHLRRLQAVAKALEVVATLNLPRLDQMKADHLVGKVEE